MAQPSQYVPLEAGGVLVADGVPTGERAMGSIHCGSCQRRGSTEDAVCLFCGADPRATASTARQAARFAVRAGGAIAIASAVVLAPVLLGACGCGGCGAPSPRVDGGGADAGPNQGDAGPQR
jgi:hypothetical protein